ncbi:MAG: methyltransferase domain-containing protein [Oligoflexia bacterium]|nr:methyltransferase domain-containing protein [Oligoflexia bacterium]
MMKKNIDQIDASILICPECKQRSITLEPSAHCTNPNCKKTFPIWDEIPSLFDRKTDEITQHFPDRRMEGLTTQDIINNAIYNWSHIFSDCDRENFEKDIAFDYHIDAVEGTLPDSFFRLSTPSTGRILEIGTGTGVDGRKLAHYNPNFDYYGVDLGFAIYPCQRSSKKRSNQRYIRASALSLPFADASFDIVYSYGVFHHTPDPYKAFSEAIRVLKPGGHFCTYLYEKHENNALKRIPLTLIESLHVLTRRLSHKQLKLLCYLISPAVLLLLSYPAQILKKTPKLKLLGNKFPYHHGTTPKSILGDLMDRFGASINYRFSKEEFANLFRQNKIAQFKITKMNDRAGYVGFCSK